MTFTFIEEVRSMKSSDVESDNHMVGRNKILVFIKNEQNTAEEGRYNIQ